MQGFSDQAGLDLTNRSAPVPGRIGIFGGAFDPPHNAHIALARAAIEQLDLAALHVIPTGHAWHKARALSAPEHRLAMVRLAFDPLERIVVDDRELQRAGPTFTIDTLRALQQENQHSQLYLLIGADQFAAFEQWHEWKTSLEIAISCISDRAHSALTSTRFDQFSPFSHRFLILKLALMPVSATWIRKAMGSGVTTTQEIAPFIPEAVARYISDHRLYRPG